MRLLIIICFFISSANSQSQKRDLFITYDDEKLFHNILIASANLEVYSIGFKGKYNPQYKFYLNENGDLLQDVKVYDDTSGSLTFMYEKDNDRNNYKKIAISDMKYIIKCSQIIYSVGTDFTTLFSKFENIYLVNIAEKKNKYKAKKINVIVNPGM